MIFHSQDVLTWQLVFQVGERKSCKAPWGLGWAITKPRLSHILLEPSQASPSSRVGKYTPPLLGKNVRVPLQRSTCREKAFTVAIFTHSLPHELITELAIPFLHFRKSYVPEVRSLQTRLSTFLWLLIGHTGGRAGKAAFQVPTSYWALTTQFILLHLLPKKNEGIRYNLTQTLTYLPDIPVSPNYPHYLFSNFKECLRKSIICPHDPYFLPPQGWCLFIPPTHILHLFSLPWILICSLKPCFSLIFLLVTFLFFPLFCIPVFQESFLHLLPILLSALLRPLMDLHLTRSIWLDSACPSFPLKTPYSFTLLTLHLLVFSLTLSIPYLGHLYLRPFLCSTFLSSSKLPWDFMFYS